MIKLLSQTRFPVVAAVVAAIATTVGAAGISMITMSGEQSKLKFDPDLWCVSNYIEQVPREKGADGRPLADIRLKNKGSWIRREQVKAKSKEEAEAKVEAQYKKFFTRSDKTGLRDALDKNNKDFFTHHFNSGATVSGPCIGTGDPANDKGLWLADAVRDECFETSGNCKIKKESIEIKDRGQVSLPATGVIAAEEHLVTKEENFQPENTKDRIERHYQITEQAIGRPINHVRSWTKAEGGGSIGGGSSPNRPPAAVEPWIVNMNWSSRPPEGTKMIIRNPQNGKTVVAAAGYETGPSDKTYLFGAQGEALQAIGAVTGTTVEVGFAEDQSLPFGPIKCNDETKPKSSAAKPKDPRCPEEAPASGPLNGEDYRADFAKAFWEQQKPKINPTGNKIADIALGEVGYQGSPGGGKGKRDCTKYDACAQWCAYFATWVYRQAGYKIPSFGSSRATLNWFENNGHPVFKDPSQAGAGDIVVWANGPDTGHIGIVVSNDPSSKTIGVVEGNTTNDIVKRNYYSYNAITNNMNGLLGFGRW